MKRALYLVLFLATAATLLASPVRPSTELGLWSEGTQLRGANLWQRRVYPELDGLDFLGPGPFGPPIAMEDFVALAAHGANWVQLSVPGLFTEQEPYQPDWAAVDNLDTLIAMADAAGLFVTITFRTGPGRSEFSILRDEAGVWFDQSYLEERVWTDPQARDAWAAMWEFTARRYREQKAVIGYDLMCEPNASDIVQEWDPHAFQARYAGSGYDWSSWYPKLALAIRRVDQETPILIQPDGYASPEWASILAPPPVSACVLAVHPYDPHAYTHQSKTEAWFRKRVYPGRFDADDDGKPEQVDALWIASMLGQAQAAAQAMGIPVCANEYGVMRWQPGAAAYLSDMLECFEDYGWNHALWEWKPAYKGYDEVNAFDFTRAAELDRLMRASWLQNRYRP